MIFWNMYNRFGLLIHASAAKWNWKKMNPFKREEPIEHFVLEIIWLLGRYVTKRKKTPQV